MHYILDDLSSLLIHKQVFGLVIIAVVITAFLYMFFDDKNDVELNKPIRD